MKKAGLIVLVTAGALTLLLVVGWILAFVLATHLVGNLVHLLLVVAVLTGFVAFVGLVLFVIGFLRKPKPQP